MKALKLQPFMADKALDQAYRCLCLHHAAAIIAIHDLSPMSMKRAYPAYVNKARTFFSFFFRCGLFHMRGACGLH